MKRHVVYNTTALFKRRPSKINPDRISKAYEHLLPPLPVPTTRARGPASVHQSSGPHQLDGLEKKIKIMAQSNWWWEPLDKYLSFWYRIRRCRYVPCYGHMDGRGLVPHGTCGCLFVTCRILISSVFLLHVGQLVINVMSGLLQNTSLLFRLYCAGNKSDSCNCQLWEYDVDIRLQFIIFFFFKSCVNFL